MRVTEHSVMVLHMNDPRVSHARIKFPSEGAWPRKKGAIWDCLQRRGDRGGGGRTRMIYKFNLPRDGHGQAGGGGIAASLCDWLTSKELFCWVNWWVNIIPRLNIRNPVLEGLLIPHIMLHSPPILAGKRNRTCGFHWPSKARFLILSLCKRCCASKNVTQNCCWYT